MRRAAASAARRAEFSHDAERLAAWESATNVFGPYARKQEAVVTPETGTAVQVM